MTAARMMLKGSLIALLGSAGVLAAAGPKWNFNLDFGNSFRGRAPERVIHEAVEYAPASLDVQAFQAGDTVVIFARGENNMQGLNTSLERTLDRRSGRMEVNLRNYMLYTSHDRDRRGYEKCATLIPFAVSGSFESRDCLREIKLNIGGEERCIPVQRIEQMARSY